MNWRNMALGASALLLIHCPHGEALIGSGTSNLTVQGIIMPPPPCTIAPEDSLISLDFGTIIDKALYSHQRSNARPFALHLTGCDLSLGNTVAVSFSGVESELPGLLALDATSQATGIAIGIETLDGEALPINQEGTIRYPLVSGSDNYIRLQAYVRAEPAELATQSITRGPFSATMTFTLTYE